MRRALTMLLCSGLGLPLAAQTRLEIHPAEIQLDHARDRQGFVVVATDAAGVGRDVTRKAELAVERGIAVIDGHVLRPRNDGESRLVAQWKGARAEAAVRVRGAGKRPAISFANEVVPTLTRAGCNAGSCHGAASGKNGFRLSLFGYDKAADHLALTRELRGRRVNCTEPAASLMLQKPTTKVAHKGGKRLVASSPHYELLQRWIAQGAHTDVGEAPALARIELLPRAAVLAGSDQPLRLVVRAFYADGTDRDVTDLTLLSSLNEGSLAIGEDAVARSKEPGEAFVMARFGTCAEIAQVIVVPGEGTFEWPEGVEPVNYIDEAVHAKLRRLRIVPAGVCSDEEFVRRVYLDVLNVLPAPDETRRFLKDEREDKRSRLVDSLLRRPEFPDVLAMQWAETLRIESQRLEAKGMYVYTDFLRRAFHDDVPFDQLVRRLLTSRGGNFTNPAANFYLTERDPKLIAENVAQNFLGIRIQCAQCHNHPFERWTMDDYYGFAAFFAQVATKRGEDPRERIVFSRGRGEVRNVRTGRNAVPKVLGGPEPKLARGADRRRALAEWLTSKENPWFAANVANRVFARFFGRGLVNPPDDVRVSNPPSHPALHRELGRRLIDYGYDLRKLIKDITASRSYQLARHRGAPPAAAFAGAAVRRLTAEQMLDAISDVCGVPTKYRGLPLGARATQVANGRSGDRFLDLFGRPARTSACTCERRNEPTLGQVLHLINGPRIEGKIRNAGGRLQRMLKAKATDAQLLEELWLAAYCRAPTEAETERVLAAARGEDRARAWEDVYWAVLNSKEFLFNH